MVSLVPEPQEAAGGSSSDPDHGTTETPPDQQIQKLQQQINRQFAIDDYKGAVSVCEELCSLISAKYDELHDACAGPYFQYATALLELARDENQVLGVSKLSQGEKEEEEGPDSTEQPDVEEPSEGGTAGEETEEGATAEETEGEEGGDGNEEPEEDVTSLQIAWEVLELSRIIYSRQESSESRRKLAKVGIKLGEICMENEKLDEALTHFTVAIDDFVECGETPDSREISSTYYMMGLAASLDQKYEGAVKHFSKCSELMESQISKTEGTEKDSLVEMKVEVDKMVSDCTDSLKQLEQYRKLVPAQSATASGGCDSSSSTTPHPAFSATSASASSSAVSSNDASSSAASSNAAPSSAASSNAASSSAASSNAAPSSAASSNAASSSAASSSADFPSAASSSAAFPNATSSSAAFPGAASSSAAVSNISHLVRKRPVSQPVQPTSHVHTTMSHAAPTSTSEITAKLSVKPTVRVSPIVSSSTSPGSSQTDRQTNGYTRTQPATTSSSAITSSNSAVMSSSAAAVVQSNEAQSSGTPAHVVRPTSSLNNQTNGVSSTTTSALEARLGGSTRGFEARLAGSTSGFEARLAGSTSGFEARLAGSTSGFEERVSGSSRQVATVSSVQRTEEAISSSSDFKRPAEDVEDMGSNEAKRSKQ